MVWEYFSFQTAVYTCHHFTVMPINLQFQFCSCYKLVVNYRKVLGTSERCMPSLKIVFNNKR